jgi:membrane-associated phospholipid phosphatase
LLATPNHPSYVSGHSTFSGAAGGILSEYFGTDLISFTVVNEDSTALPGGYTRSFDSISSAVDEAGQSRIYGGIHFQFDNVDGKVAGAQISDFVFANYLGAVPEPSTAFLALLSGSLLMMRRRR